MHSPNWSVDFILSSESNWRACDDNISNDDSLHTSCLSCSLMCESWESKADVLLAAEGLDDGRGGGDLVGIVDLKVKNTQFS